MRQTVGRNHRPGVVAMGSAAPASADMEAAIAFLDDEFERSSLSRAEQEEEMQWFVDAAAPFQGMEIKVVSETITTHEYESQVLAPAFTAITGITVTHDLIGEGDVVEKLQTQMQSGENIYDAYINDSDLIGTHWRYQQARNLTDWMAGEGADVTNPRLDLDDFIGCPSPPGRMASSTSCPTSSSRTFTGSATTGSPTPTSWPISKAEYGYDLGVPVNWSAYEDIAEFFTGRDLSHMGRPDEVYGNMDYGKPRPLAGLAFHRCVDVDGRHGRYGRAERPAGRRMGHPGQRELAAGRLLRRAGRGDQRPGRGVCHRPRLHRLAAETTAPPAGRGHDLLRSRSDPAQGAIAQQMFWYTAFTADMVGEGAAAVLYDDGTPRWRMAPEPARCVLGRRHEDRLPGRR